MIAIDPGKKGGIAYTTHDGGVAVMKMPATMADMYDSLEQIRDAHPENRKAVVELVGHMPGDGGKGSFTFGEGVGWLHMAMYALKISVEESVQPAAWQKVVRLPKEPTKGLTQREESARTRRRKNMIKDQMQRRYPHINPKQVTLAVSDALGIYTYAVNRGNLHEFTKEAVNA